MRARVAKLLGHRVTQNAGALYVVQMCTYVLPLITLPYLARTLGPAGWGPVLFAQALGAVVAIVVEYGFDFSATRETARNANDPQIRRRLIAGVLGAKLILTALCACAAVLARPYLSRVTPSSALFWGSLIWGAGQGINMLWYFQGMQRMRVAGALDIGGKLVSTLSIFLLVHRPSDGWKVLAAQATGCIVAHAATVVMAYRDAGFAWPSPSLAMEALRMGWPMFLFRASQTVTGANGLILGLMASPLAVSFYVAADKVTLAVRQAVWPLTQALFPHQAQKVTGDLLGAAKTVRRSLIFIGGFSVLGALVLCIAAPLIVKLAFGASFLPAVPTLRMLTLLLPLSTIASVFCFQWMVPLGLDGQVGKIVLFAGLITVLTGIPLSARFSHLGMAVAAVLAETFVLISFNVVLRRAHLNPLSSLDSLRAVDSVEPEMEKTLA